MVGQRSGGGKMGIERGKARGGGSKLLFKVLGVWFFFSCSLEDDIQPVNTTCVPGKGPAPVTVCSLKDY